jgi:hypothetical protein
VTPEADESRSAPAPATDARAFSPATNLILRAFVSTAATVQRVGTKLSGAHTVPNAAHHSDTAGAFPLARATMVVVREEVEASQGAAIYRMPNVTTDGALTRNS